MRAFLAVETGQPGGPGMPVDHGPAPAHLTLRFLGDLAPTDVARVIESIPAAVRDVAPFDLALGGVGAFPSRERPRVVWIGVTTGAPEVRQLAQRIREALADVRLPPAETEFVPHVTLFRVRGPRDRERAADLLGGRIPAPTAPPIQVVEVVLKESELSPRGPVHRTVRSFALGRAAPR